MDAKSQRRWFAAASVAPAFILTVIAGLLGFLAWQNAPAPRASVSLPIDSEISKVTATWTPFESDPVTSDEFVVPHKYVARILKHFRDATEVEAPFSPEEDNVAVLTLHKTNGQSMDLRLSFIGKSPLGFTLDGVNYARDGSYHPVAIMDDYESYAAENMLIAGILRCIQREQSTGIAGARLEELFEDLERSEGNLPALR